MISLALLRAVFYQGMSWYSLSVVVCWSHNADWSICSLDPSSMGLELKAHLGR